MQLNVTGHHIDVTDSLRDYVGNKMGKIEKHFENVTDIHCILSVEKVRHKAEAIASLRGARLHAEATEDDMYAAIDSLSDKLDRQIIKHKEKLRDHHAREAQKMDMPVA
ncbi:MAG: ribosome-associated translation inhibitor RaiA [Pseudomonadota bacterium]